MENFPRFQSDQEYTARKSDVAFWRPLIARLLEAHHLQQPLKQIQPGFNSTYPVFVLDEFVIKFFCHRQNWPQVFKKESAAHQVIAANPEILAPRVVAKGEETKHKHAFGYKISTRIAGHSWLNTSLSRPQQIVLMNELGGQIKMIHSLSVENQFIEKFDGFSHLDVKSAAQKSSLPKHLIAQIDDFLGKLQPFDSVLVNSDMVAMHVFIHQNHLSGIIDWGDAAITDRHYELGKLTLEFPGDKALLKQLLLAADWPMTPYFAQQTLGMALYRQAVGLTQHNTFDIFYKLPNEIKEFESIPSLSELAKILFEIDF